jgi:hypothetical protein
MFRDSSRYLGQPESRSFRRPAAQRVVKFKEIIDARDLALFSIPI